MSRGKKLIVFAVLLVACIAGFIIASQIDKNRPAEDPKEGTELESDSQYTGYGQLIEYEMKDIETIEIKNDLDTVTLKSDVQVIKAEDEESEDTYDVIWKMVGHEEWTLDQYVINNTVDLCTSLFANRLADEDGTERNLADFGLDKPISTLTVTLHSGDVIKINVGNRTTDGKYYYGMIEGNDAIYTLGRNAGNTAEFTTENLRYLAALTPEEEGEIWYVLVENADGRNTEVSYAGIVDESGDDLTYYNANSFKLAYGGDYAYPIQRFVTGDLQETIYNTLPEVSLSDQIEENVEDLSKYGLAAGTAEHHYKLIYRMKVDPEEIQQAIDAGYEIDTSEAVYDEVTNASYWYITLEYYFGYEYQAEDGTPMVYFRYSEGDDVFGVPKSVVDQFHFEPYAYVQKTIYINNIDNVDHMTLRTPAGTYECQAKRGEATVDADGKKQQDVVFRINDQLVETKSFRKLYQAFIGVMSDYEIYGEKPEYDESDCYSVDYTFTDGSTRTVTFYRMNEFYYVTQVADDAWFACKYTQFGDIDSWLETCLKGE